MHVGTRPSIQGQGGLGKGRLRRLITDLCRSRHGSKCLMFQNKEEVIFHDVFLICHEPHFIRRMYFFYKRMVQSWVRKYESDAYTDHARAQYLQRLETKLTRKELRYIFNMAVYRRYIIPHIDRRAERTAGQQSTASTSNSEDGLIWVLLEEEDGDCAVLTNREDRKRMKLNEPN